MSRSSKQSFDDHHYDDHEPINPNKSEDDSFFGVLFSSCCGPCYRWYSRHTHQKLVNTLHQSEHDDDWGLGRDSSGAIRLSPKHTKDLTSFDHRRSGGSGDGHVGQSPSSFSVSVTSEDTHKQQRQPRSNKNGSSGSAAAAATSSSSKDRPSQFYHDTDVLLAVSAVGGEDEDGEDITLAKTMRPSFGGGSSSRQQHINEDDEPMDDYMSSSHQSHHGMSSYFRSGEESDDSLEKEMENQLRGGGGSSGTAGGKTSNSNISRSKIEKQREEEESIFSTGQLSFSLDGEDMAAL